MIYARKGEVVVCENGHPVCELARDVNLGETFDPSDLVNWKQSPPKIGDTAPRCVCGARYWRGDNLAQNFHFIDGWRPEKLNKEAILND